MSPHNNHLDENKDIADFLAPLREPVDAPQSEERLESLLALAKDLGPKLGLWASIVLFIRKIFKDNPLWRILIVISVVIITMTAFFGILFSFDRNPPASPPLERDTPLVETPVSDEVPLLAPVEETAEASPTSTALPSPTMTITPTMVTETATPTATAAALPSDADGDGIEDSQDNCPNAANPSQYDSDGDGIGNACDATPTGDQDLDGVDNGVDNCPYNYNPGQRDSDGDGIGDACDKAHTATPVPPTATPTATPTAPPASLITINVTGVSSGDIVTGVGNTRFGAIAYDEVYGTSDGDGIASVTFFLSGPGGFSHSAVDTSAPFCEFGGTSPCNTMGNPMWASLVNGNYTLTLTTVSISGESKSVVVIFTINVP